MLHHFHDALASHYSDLRAARAKLEPASPVFALEHDLPPDDLDLLKGAVRNAIKLGHLSRYQRAWLPFVVYAAEVGYGYVGDEYWTTFTSLTPRWTSQERSTVRDWFVQFHRDFGGAHPSGAWADHFTIIAWPITHAVLPTYLQRNLAKLLFEFSGALTSDLLDDPEALGVRLARRASNYTERFRIFCQNTALVGQVAVALLSGESEPTPFLSASTLARIVDGLSTESQARNWLKSARASARRVRGFRSGERGPAGGATPKRLPRATDPRLFLRKDGVWTAYAELPDLTVVGLEGQEIYGQLRTSRATVSGAARPIPPSGLLYPGQEVSFASWPRPDQPFLRLDRGDPRTNSFLATQCVITKGPWWLFRRQGTGLAIEVKGKFVRPGHQYLLVGVETLTAPPVPWCAEVAITARGVRAFDLWVPPHLKETDEEALLATGLSVVSHVAIRPVGTVASAWDGEGEVEWVAGEPAILGIRSDLVPKRARVVVADTAYFLDWTADEPELLFTLEGLPVGTHELSVALFGNGERQLASGALVVTIRDPQVRAEGATIGEGIRMLANPARPTLAELWDERAAIAIDGPPGTGADLSVALLDDKAAPLVNLRRSVHLPLGEADWRTIARSVRTDQRFVEAYDNSESCIISVSRDGIGFATLTSERGFQPLRWRLTRSHDGDVIAKLVDRTDGGTTSLDFYNVDTPLTAVRKNPAEVLSVPPRGGLVIARAGDSVAAAMLPTNPTALLHMPSASPVVPASSRTPKEVLRLAEGHRRWIHAELPADAFAAYQQRLVGDAIARAIGTLIGGSHWAAIELAVAGARDAADHLEAMQAAVGVSTEQKAVASTIAYSLYRWLKPEELLPGFHGVISPHLTRHGLDGRRSVPRFLLMLAGRPGYITEWDPSEAATILDRVLLSPVLYRAARFAVLGTRALNDAEGVERSF
ncbi:hypothetical protein CCO02nite_27710 [Cellulomonas composti]|uniref:Uncharacterized protein n=1 Tax=Cellulomonas composti TaxID=266130 RepID=A0A511JEE4_9CELL|nr:hypothetical protein CCO02nite_27710 [Cellulomonas composti]